MTAAASRSLAVGAWATTEDVVGLALRVGPAHATGRGGPGLHGFYHGLYYYHRLAHGVPWPFPLAGEEKVGRRRRQRVDQISCASEASRLEVQGKYATISLENKKRKSVRNG